MNCTAPVLCILLGWSDPAAAPRPAHPAPAPKALEGPAYEVMQVKSGVEIAVKIGGKSTPILLAGIGTPRTGAKPDVDRLSQMNYLRKLIAVGSKVKLEGKDATRPDAQGRRRAQVIRGSDGLWVNNDLVAKGYGTVLPGYAERAGVVFREAEKRAQEARIGMWASDFAASAARPATFERAQRPRAQTRPVLPDPGVDMMPAIPDTVPVATVPPVGYGSGPNLGVGSGPYIVTPDSFAVDEFGNQLSAGQQRQRYQNWLTEQGRRDQRGTQVLGELTNAIRDGRQQGQNSATGAGQNSPGTTYTPYTPYTPYSAPMNGGNGTSPSPVKVFPPAAVRPGEGKR